MSWKDALLWTVIGLSVLLFAYIAQPNIANAAPTVCQIGNGCTGTSTAANYGQLLIGGKNGEYEFVASSTLGGGSSAFSTSSASYWLTQQTTSNLAEGSNLYYTLTRWANALAGTTTDALAEGVNNLYFTNARAIAALTGQNVSIFANNIGYLTPATFDTDFDNRLSATTSLPNITTLSGLSLPYSQLTGTPNLSQYLSLSSWFATTSAPQLTSLANLSTVGTVSSGVWQGTPIADTYISSASNWNNKVSSSSLSATYPLTYNSSTGAFSFKGLSTTSPWTTLQLAQVSSSGAISSIATSSLGLTTTAFASPNVSQWTNDAGYVTSSFSTTSAAYWQSVNNFFSTTSAAYWQGQNNFFSTTSASYFLSLNQGPAFSTTSANYLLSTKGYITSAASTTLLGDSNTFSGHNIFSASTTINAQLNLQGASSTVFSATTICLTGDTCRTTWPSGGSSASSTLLIDNNTFSGTTQFGNNLDLGTSYIYGGSFGSGEYFKMAGAGQYTLENGNNGYGVNIGGDVNRLTAGGEGHYDLEWDTDTGISRSSAGVLSLDTSTYQNGLGGLLLASSTMTNLTTTYASTTETDASTLCLSGTCKTSWPSGTVTSVTATYPILSTGGTTPVISTAISTSTLFALSDWFATTTAPQLTTLANLATVGTISSGTWHGTAIADSYISSSGNWNTAYTDRITSANYPLSITSNVLSTVGTSSENCTVSCFASANISQWTNNSGYITTTGIESTSTNPFMATYFVATGTTASNLPYASTTAWSITSTSTGTSGINLSGGCFAINGTCITGGGGGGSGTVTSVTLATPNSTLTLGGTNPITTSGTINADLNLSHSNWWTALQNYTNATTSGFEATSTNVFFDGPAVGSLLATNANHQLIATTTIADSLLQTNLTAGSCTNCNLTYNAQGLLTVAANGTGGSGGISWPWTAYTNYGTSTNATSTPYQAWEGIFASSTSHFANADFSIATATTLAVGPDGAQPSDYQFTWSGEGTDYLDLQNASTTELFTEMRLLSNLDESTLSSVVDCSGQNLFNNQIWLDHSVDNYPSAHEAIISDDSSGTCTTPPLVFQVVANGANIKNSTHLVMWPSGSNTFGNFATTSDDQASELQIASSTATNVLAVDSTPGTHLFTVQSAGNVGIGVTGTPGQKLEVDGNIFLNAAGTGLAILSRGATSNYGGFQFDTNSTAEWTLGLRPSDNTFHFFNENLSTDAATINQTNNLWTLADASTTAVTVSNFLTIPNGSTEAPLQAGSLALDTTVDQLVVGNGTGTTVFDPRTAFILGVSSTTALTGTTTSPAFSVPIGISVTGISCTVQPVGAAAEIEWQYANPSAYTTVTPTYFAASSTPGIEAVSANNTPQQQATTTISVGNPSGSPLSAYCSFIAYPTAL